MHLEPGTTIDGNEYTYTVVSTLGQGAFGITYLVQSRLKADSRAGVRTMALKEYFIKGVNGRQHTLVTCATEGGIFDRMRSRFINEARNLGDFNSAGIVKIYEAFDANNTSYFSMEHIAGGNLEAYINDHGPLPAATIKSFARQMAMSLRTMHRKNMLHLDMKPSNVMMRDDNSLVLIDFGFSKRFDDEGNPQSSSALEGGTDLYRPLEQQNYKGTYNSGLPTTLDVYSLSATIFKMATGRDPMPPIEFDEQFPYSLLEAKGASPQLIEMLAKGLALRPRDRIQNMDEYLKIIETLPEEYTRQQVVKPVTEDGDADDKPLTDTVKNDSDKGAKSKTPWVIGILAAVIAAIVAVWLAGRNSDKPDVPPTEEPESEYYEITAANGQTFKYIGELDSAYTTPIPHGYGTGQYAAGTYTGEYRHGLRHGKGIFDSSDSLNHFEGTFADDHYSRGKLTMSDGMYYKGTFKDGKPYTGIWFNADNSVYYRLNNGK